MVWILVIFAAFLLVTGFVSYLLFTTSKRSSMIVELNKRIVEEERERKLTLLKELAELSLGLIAPEDLASAQKQLAEIEEAIRSEQGRIAISDVEFDSLEIRLKEMLKIEEGLRSGQAEAEAEIEALRKREQDILNQNEQMKEELNGVVSNVDELVDELAQSQEIAKKLAAAKIELVESRAKIDWYRDQINDLNVKYLELKKAYDALDIEYAQIYEKQGALS